MEKKTSVCKLSKKRKTPVDRLFFLRCLWSGRIHYSCTLNQPVWQALVIFFGKVISCFVLTKNVYNSIGLSVLISINVIFNLRIPLTRCFIKRGKRGESILCKKIFYCSINDPPPPPIQIFQGSQGFGTSLRIQPPLHVPRPQGRFISFQQNVPSGEERRLYSQALETQTNRQTEHEVKGSH